MLSPSVEFLEDFEIYVLRGFLCFHSCIDGSLSVEFSRKFEYMFCNLECGSIGFWVLLICSSCHFVIREFMCLLRL